MENESFERCGDQEQPDQTPPAWKKEVKYILSDEWVANQCYKDSSFLDTINLKELRPDLLPADQVLAEMIVVRDRLRGIEHPGLDVKTRARW